MFNFSCTSAEPPSRLQPQRITSSHTQKPSNTLCWAYLEQVTLNVCLYVHSVAVYKHECCLHTLTFWKTCSSLVCSAGYVAYFIAACVLNFQRAIALVVLTCLVVAAATYELVKEYQGERISKCFKPAVRFFKSFSKWINW